MTAPHPDVVAKALDHLADRSGPLATEYRWLYPSASTRTNRGPSTGGGNTHEDGSPTNLSDLLASTSFVRGKITSAGICVLEAVNQIHRAMALLDEVKSAIDKGAPIQPTLHERAVEHPADKGDVRRARQAQVRRNERMSDRVLPWSAEEVTG